MSSADSSPKTKRVKFCVEENQVVPPESVEEVEVHKPITVRANAHIHLCYHDPLLTVPYHTFPEYTHQLFDEETIGKRLLEVEGENGAKDWIAEEERVFISEEEAKHFKIEVHIDTRTWRQAVNITGLTGEGKDLEDRLELIQSRMSRGVANDATFYHDHHFHFPSTLATITDKEEEELLEKPRGKLLRSFTVGDSSVGDIESYETYLCGSDDKATALLLARAEKVAMWFIETADSVEFFNNQQWELIALYQYQTDSKNGDEKTVTRSFVGYITLFTFHTPLVGSRLRICQALISPYKQSKGLGRELMRDVYQLAHSREHIIEVTVEDPCPGFQRLRDIVDYEWAVEQSKAAGESENKWWEESEVNLSSSLKITKAQAVFVQEAYEYLQLINTLDAHYKVEDDEDNAAENECAATTANHHSIDHMTDLEKLAFLHKKVENHEDFSSFRLKVKRHLLKENKDLKYLDSSKMKKELSKIFDKDRLNRFHHILRAMYRLGLVDNGKVLSKDFLSKLL